MLVVLPPFYLLGDFAFHLEIAADFGYLFII